MLGVLTIYFFSTQNDVTVSKIFTARGTATVAQWLRTLVLHVVGLVLDSQSRQTYVVITRSDNSAAKRSAIGVSVTEITILNGYPV